MKILETPRLLLRSFTENDLDGLSQLYQDPDVMRYVGTGTRTREESEKALEMMIRYEQEHGFGMWVVVHKEDQKMIGRCGLIYLDGTPEIEVGYVLAKDYWGKGLASEAAQEVIRYGFEKLNLNRIVAIAKEENTGSRRVMEKAGMKFEKMANYYNTEVVYYSLEKQV